MRVRQLERNNGESEGKQNETDREETSMRQKGKEIERVKEDRQGGK